MCFDLSADGWLLLAAGDSTIAASVTSVDGYRAMWGTHCSTITSRGQSKLLLNHPQFLQVQQEGLHVSEDKNITCVSSQAFIWCCIS